MHKLISIVLLLMCTNILAQTVLFHENFDQPSGADSVSTLSLLGTNPTLWSTSNALYTSAGHSYNVKGSVNSSIVAFETQAFSTVGQNYVYLKFSHILKAAVINWGYVEVSLNNGATWSNVCAPGNYYGESPNYNIQLDYFSSISHPLDWFPASTTGPNSIPTNQWWKEELIDLTPLVGAGYSQVKIRFRFKVLGPMPPGSFLDGWYIDDLLVTGTTCETFKPEIAIDTPVVCPQTTVLQGPLESPSSFSETRTFIATDNIGIDSLRLVEIINNNTSRYSSLTPGSQNRYYASYTNYNSFDTIQWRVEAYDTCGNMSSFPDSGYYEFYFEQDLPKCPGGNCNQGHNFINIFPWSQDFESSNWVPGNQIPGTSSIRGSFPTALSYEVTPPTSQYWGWSINTGYTFTTQTGPSSDNTAGNGKYLYTEFYGQNGLSGSSFNLPCIDLRDSTARMLSFYYHMYGSDIRRLAIHIDSTYNSSTANWHIAKAIDGQQHSSESQGWSKAYLDLSPYIGKVIKLRFYGVKDPSPTTYAHIAIDDIEISDIDPSDIAVERIISPNVESMACFGTSNVSITVNTVVIGAQAATNVPLAYQIDNNPVVFDTLDLSGKTFGFDTNYTFNNVISLSPTSPHTIRVWSSLNTDANYSNDTVKLEVPVQQYQAINTFPHRLDFESETAGLGILSNLNSSYWSLDRSPDSLTYWTVEQGPFLSDHFSPENALGKGSKALVIRKGQGNNQSFAEIESQCIDLSSLSAPVFQFLFSGESNIIDLYVKEFGDLNWTPLSKNISPPSNKDPMNGASISLSAYAGKIIKLKIKAQNPTSNNGVTVIDNIMIREQPIQDLEIKKVGLARIYENQTTYATARVFYTNWGQPTGVNYSKILKVEIQDKCNPSSTVYTAQSSTLNTLGTALNGFETFTNITFSNQVSAGEYSAKIWVEGASDIYPNNDTVYQDLICLKGIELPYVNDFENCDNQIYAYGWNQQWQIGTGKSSLDSIRDGNYCVLTNPIVNSFSTSAIFDFLELPSFSGLDTIYGAEIGFLQSFSFGTPNSFGVVEIYDGQTWRQLTNGNYYGTNWKSYTTNVQGNSVYSHGFTGSSNGWIHSSYPLEEYKSPGEKVIRFVTHNENVPGWAIDSIYIDYPEQNSGAPIALNLQGNVAQAGLNVADLKIKNTASAPLNEIRISIEESGTVIHTEIATFSPAILAGQSATVPLSQPLLLDSTMSQLVVYTSRPNDRKDEITADDTLIVPIQILGTVDSSNTCFNFERQFDFSPYSPTRGLSNTGWEKGSPSKTLLDSAYAGSSCWFTSGNEYEIQQNSYLYTPEFALTGTYCYRLGFWHQFDFEKNFDGANVEYTLDGGNSWDVLGRYWSTDSAWYNHQYIQSLDANKPGWSGNSGGWIYSNYDFHVFWDDTVQFRFRYATDADINYEGWAIDEVCFEVIPESCTSIGIDEEETVQSEIALYPNPATSELNLKCGLEGVYEIAIYSSKGSLIRSWSENLEMGKILQIDIEALTPGFYSIGINGHSTSTSKRFVKTR